MKHNKLTKLLSISLITTSLILSACGGKQADSYEGTNNAAESAADETEETQQKTVVSNEAQNTEIGTTTSISDDKQIDLMLSALPESTTPSGLCTDGESLYVTDIFSKKIWKVTEENAEVIAGDDSVQDIYGNPMGGYNDAESEKALFRQPWAIAPFLDGFAVSDTENDALRLVRESNVETINAREAGKDLDMTSKYNYPTGLAADTDGNLYVSDTHSDKISVISAEGECFTFIKGINSPMGLCWNNGFLYVAETGAERIIRIETTNPYEEKGKNDIQLVAGSGETGSDDGDVLSATFSSPKGITVTPDGKIYVADTVNGTVRVISGNDVSTLEGIDDESSGITLTSPVGLCYLGKKLYVADSFGKRIFTVELE